MMNQLLKHCFFQALPNHREDSLWSMMLKEWRLFKSSYEGAREYFSIILHFSIFAVTNWNNIFIETFRTYLYVIRSERLSKHIKWFHCVPSFIIQTKSAVSNKHKMLGKYEIKDYRESERLILFLSLNCKIRLRWFSSSFLSSTAASLIIGCQYVLVNVSNMPGEDHVRVSVNFIFIAPGHLFICDVK